MTKHEDNYPTAHFSTYRQDKARPLTMMQAMMENRDDEESVEELQPLREAVVDCIEQLSTQDQFIVDAINSEFLSFSQLAARLGVSKPHAWRLKNAAYTRLEMLLKIHPVIRKRINMLEKWEDSAEQWVTQISSLATEEADYSIDHLRSLRDAGKTALIGHQEPPSPLLWTEIAIEAIQTLRKAQLWNSEEMVTLLARKQHDYGHQNILEFGLIGILVRLSDKIERLENVKGKQTKFESYNDTLRDIVGYCVVALMVHDNTFKLNLGTEYE